MCLSFVPSVFSTAQIRQSTLVLTFFASLYLIAIAFSAMQLDLFMMEFAGNLFRVMITLEAYRVSKDG